MTAGAVGAILVGSLVLLGIAWLTTEIKALRDTIPDNHITAVVRKAVKDEPGPFIAFAWIVGFLCGHLFWQ